MAWFIISKEGYVRESVVNDLDVARLLAKESSKDSPGIKLIVQDMKNRTLGEYLDGKELYACAEESW